MSTPKHLNCIFSLCTVNASKLSLLCYSQNYTEQLYWLLVKLNMHHWAGKNWAQGTVGWFGGFHLHFIILIDLQQTLPLGTNLCLVLLYDADLSYTFTAGKIFFYGTVYWCIMRRDHPQTMFARRGCVCGVCVHVCMHTCIFLGSGC